MTAPGFLRAIFSPTEVRWPSICEPEVAPLRTLAARRQSTWMLRALQPHPKSVHQHHMIDKPFCLSDYAVSDHSTPVMSHEDASSCGGQIPSLQLHNALCHRIQDRARAIRLQTIAPATSRKVYGYEFRLCCQRRVKIPIEKMGRVRESVETNNQDVCSLGRSDRGKVMQLCTIVQC